MENAGSETEMETGNKIEREVPRNVWNRGCGLHEEERIRLVTNYERRRKI